MGKGEGTYVQNLNFNYINTNRCIYVTVTCRPTPSCSPSKVWPNDDEKDEINVPMALSVFRDGKAERYIRQRRACLALDLPLRRAFAPCQRLQTTAVQSL